MAAANVASTKRPRVLGDVKLLVVAYTSVADTNTATVPGGAGTNVLGAVILQSSTSAAVTVSLSGQTATFHVSTGTPNVTVGYIIG